ncbi:MAG: peptide deformylase [Bacilli bacterium]|jgi:peptide deformylase|nr:peptide deformylase [Acholeplasmataceae bacterium]
MILMNDIVREGAEVLKTKAQEVKLPLSVEDEQTLIKMNEYILNSIDPEISEKYGLRGACGLAANQINILKRMLVMRDYDENNQLHHYMMINPKIISYSDELTYLPGGEGCLSVDREVVGLVHRPRKVTVKTYLYENGEVKEVTLRLKDYIAIVFQHEYDHLNGILFVDRINKDFPLNVPENSTPVRFKRAEEEK